MRTAALFLLAVAALGGLALFFGEAGPPEIAFVRARRGDVSSALTTNGRIEAARRFDVHSETAGPVLRVPVEAGQSVESGAALAVIGDRPAQSAAQQAKARLDAARADLAALKRGLSAAERLEIESQIEQRRRELRALRADRERIGGLVEKNAAPRVELDAVERRIADAEAAREMWSAKLEVGPAPEQLDRARAVLREAEIALAAARRAVSSATVRAPANGRVYSLAVRPSDYVARGELVARIAEKGPLRARIFIDEPELGRVELGARARLTADAFPGRDWSCVIDRLPTEIVKLDNRRVGEVRCAVVAEAELLIPNLTVNVTIETASAEDVVVVPREAIIRTENGEAVWTVTAEGLAERRTVETGVRGTEAVEIRSGVREDEVVLLPGAAELDEGAAITLAPEPESQR